MGAGTLPLSFPENRAGAKRRAPTGHAGGRPAWLSGELASRQLAW